MDHHLGGYGGLLHHAAVGGQVALEHRDAAGLGVGVVDGADDVGIAVDHTLQILGHRLAGAGHQAGVQQAGLCQLGHNGVHAAGPLQVLHIGISRRGQVTQVGRLQGDLIGHVEGQLDAALVGNGGQVKHSVGGAAQGHVHRLRVVEGGLGHNVPGADVLLHQFHDLHARVLGQAEPGGPHGGDGAVAP